MNTTHNPTTRLLRLAAAAVATPAVLLTGAGTAQADSGDSDSSYSAGSDSLYTSSPDSSYTSSPDSSYTSSPDSSYSAGSDSSYTSSPDSLYTSSPDSLYTSSPDSSYTSSPDSSYTSSPDSSYTSSPDSLYTSSPDPGFDVVGDGTATVGGPLGPNFPSSGLWQGPSAHVPQSAADVWFPDGPPEIRESLPPAPPATSQATPWCNAACHQDYDDPVMPKGANPFAPIPPTPLKFNTDLDPNYVPYDGPTMGPYTATPEQEKEMREYHEGLNALREGRLMEHLFGPEPPEIPENPGVPGQFLPGPITGSPTFVPDTFMPVD